MGGGEKRKSRGGTEVTPKSRKRKTTAAAIPTRKEGSPPDSDIDEPQLEDIIKMQLDSESKPREGGGDHRMKTRLRRRLVNAGTEESAPQIIGFIVDPNPVKVEPEVDPENENHQPELNDDFIDQDLADSDIDVGEVKYVPHPALPEDKFTHEDEEVDGLDSNRILDEVETPSADANQGNAAHSTSEPSDSDARVGQTECGNDTGREKSNNSNISTDTNAQHKGTIRLEDGHVGDGTIGSQHIAGGTTATEPETLSIAPDIEGYVDGAPSGGMQAATVHIELLHQKVDSKNACIQELAYKTTLFEDDDRNIGVECEVLKEELEEARSENETLQRKLHTKRVDLVRQTGRAKILEEEQRILLQENSRTVERLEGELKKKTNLFKNAISDRDALIVRHADEMGRLKEEIEQLNTENERQASENKRLKKDNADLRRLITEKDKVIQTRTVDIEVFQKDLKILDDDSKARKAELDDVRKLADKNSRSRVQLEEANKKIEELKNSMSEKDNEIAEVKARYYRDKEGNFQLHLAAKIGDEQAIQNLIQLGADVNARNSKGETPIFLVGVREADDDNEEAESIDYEEDMTLRMVKALIKHGTDVFATDREGQTFIHKFASAESPVTPSQFHEISSHLVSKNISSLFNTRNMSPYNGSTPLMVAAVNSKLQPRTASFLHENIENGIDFRLKDYREKSLMCYAVEVHNTQKLLAGTFKPEQTTTTEASGEELVKLLVRLGADAKETSLLHLAAESKNKTFAINIVKFLIHCGANGEAKDTYGDTFLQRLLARSTTAINPAQFHDMAVFLISKGLSRLFNTRGCDNCGRDCTDGTQFQNAVSKVEIKRVTLSLLKANGVDFNAVDRSGYRVSVLYSATSGNRTLKMISDLVDLGADPMFVISTRWNETMLHIAASKGRHDLLKFFLDKGLDVNAQDEYGYTPLHKTLSCSPKANVFKTIQFLLRNGANSDVKNKAGSWCESLSPFEYFEANMDEFSDADKISTCFSLGSSC